jgi:hypothetical protein
MQAVRCFGGRIGEEKKWRLEEQRGMMKRKWSFKEKCTEKR